MNHLQESAGGADSLPKWVLTASSRQKTRLILQRPLCTIPASPVARQTPTVTLTSTSGRDPGAVLQKEGSEVARVQLAEDLALHVACEEAQAQGQGGR
jgi:hypothetical protein